MKKAYIILIPLMLFAALVMVLIQTNEIKSLKEERTRMQIDFVEMYNYHDSMRVEMEKLKKDNNYLIYKLNKKQNANQINQFAEDKQ